jgi:hypothetical protein
VVTRSVGRVQAIAVLSRVVVVVPDRCVINMCCVKWQEPETLLRIDTGRVLSDSLQCYVMWLSTLPMYVQHVGN